LAGRYTKYPHLLLTPMKLERVIPILAAALASVAFAVDAHAQYVFRTSVPGLTAQQAPQPPQSIGIVANGTTRTWADGTLAASCKAYLSGDGLGHTYSGATGNGLYRIQLSAPTDVRCDMSNDGGGWTLVINAVARDTLGWNTSAGVLNASALASQTRTAKLADVDIHKLTTDAIRLQSPLLGAPRFVKPSCQYGQTTVPTVANGCGTTYDSLSWTGAHNFNDFQGFELGISDYDVSADSMFFSTSDTRDFSWWTGVYARTNYGAGNGGFATPTGFVIWAR
jgi:hypothetical protein